jgi:uncharacterized protein
MSPCVFHETCGQALALEHNGDRHAYYHYIEPRYRLGNARAEPLPASVASEARGAFGDTKRESLTRFCPECHLCFYWNGGRPKNRILKSPPR